MSAEFNPIPAFGDPIGPWHWWFAWWPVNTFDGRWVWLRKVYRRRIQKHAHLSGGPMSWWQHAYPRGYVTDVRIKGAST